ncbi:MAG: nucleoside-diphosphate-sugar epimerase [Arenicella sp.]|jgi:nucleoside-diphosphate-sugar epimerase
MKNALIIGASSLGGTIANRLTEQNLSYTIATRSGTISSYYWKTRLPAANVIQADLLSSTTNIEALKNIDVIFFTAAPKYWLWQEELEIMVQSGLDLARKLNAVFVYADNLYAYGEPVTTLTETTGLDAKSRKGRARKAALERINDSHVSGAVQAAVVQASDFYGPSVEISMLGKDLFTAALAGKTVYLLGKTDKQHSFTYIEDFADAMIQVSRASDSYGEVWIAPTSEPISVDTFLDKLSKQIGQPIAKKVAPKLIFYILGLNNKPIKELREVYYLYNEDFIVSSEKFINKFQAKATPVDRGIEAAIASYKES